MLGLIPSVIDSVKLGNPHWLVIILVRFGVQDRVYFHGTPGDLMWL